MRKKICQYSNESIHWNNQIRSRFLPIVEMKFDPIDMKKELKIQILYCKEYLMLHHKIAQRSQNRQKKTEKKILK